MIINDEQKNSVQTVAEKYGLDLLMLFGSYAEDRNTKNSDIDIGYLKSERLSFDAEIELASLFQTIFKIKRADIVYIPSSSPLFMYMILQKGKILFKRNLTLFPNIYTYALKRFEDNKPLYKARFDYLCKQYQVV
ncbi:MAG: nucleotidyltransferase domain-containing protein [Candidatus Nomurabacteria bacterium]|nr:nucleotidyltransferase domain-containing protein [Candidatus Nomurabacteria bacterium]